MWLKIIILSVCIINLQSHVYAQQAIPLYTGSIPNSINYNMHEITLLDLSLIHI